MPTREEVLKYIEENPDRAGKRELAKAFNIKGDARVYLKDLLRELADEGLVEKRARKLSRPGSLPSVAVLDITGRDEGWRPACPPGLNGMRRATASRQWSCCGEPGLTRRQKVALSSALATAFWRKSSAMKITQGRIFPPA
ncbi:hypothetical protein VXQ18_06310 [Brucella abortus]|nr:hypothetical protein [Brucella abortus]